MNVDLDIVSSVPLDGLVEAMGEDVFVLYVGGKGRKHVAHVELASSHMGMSADRTITGLVALVRELPPRYWKIWRAAKSRDFNVGIEAGLDTHSYELRFDRRTVDAVAEVEADLVVTVYAPDLNRAPVSRVSKKSDGSEEVANGTARSPGGLTGRCSRRATRAPTGRLETTGAPLAAEQHDVRPHLLMCVRVAVFCSALISLAAMQADVSEFRRYPAEAPLRGAPAKIKLETAKARRMRTLLREAALAAPNFNGHYRVTRWGCGSNCIEWAVIDLATGKVWFAPEPAFSCWAVDEGSKRMVADWFDTRVDSSLLYVHQCTRRGSDGAFDTRHVYGWADGKLRFVRADRLAD